MSAPRATPTVFRTKSHGDETRLGSRACSTSMARLVPPPMAIGGQILPSSAADNPIPSGTKTIMLPTMPITKATERPKAVASAVTGRNWEATWGLGRSVIQKSHAAVANATIEPASLAKRRTVIILLLVTMSNGSPIRVENRTPMTSESADRDVAVGRAVSPTRTD